MKRVQGIQGFPAQKLEVVQSYLKGCGQRYCCGDNRHRGDTNQVCRNKVEKVSARLGKKHKNPHIAIIAKNLCAQMWKKVVNQHKFGPPRARLVAVEASVDSSKISETPANATNATKKANEGSLTGSARLLQQRQNHVTQDLMSLDGGLQGKSCV